MCTLRTIMHIHAHTCLCTHMCTYMHSYPPSHMTIALTRTHRHTHSQSHFTRRHLARLGSPSLDSGCGGAVGVGGTAATSKGKGRDYVTSLWEEVGDGFWII